VTALSWATSRRRSVDWRAVLVAVVVAAGHTLRVGRLAARVLPGLGGAACLVVAGAQLAPWLGWAAAGVFLLALDRRST
jgi:hypothetical protein